MAVPTFVAASSASTNSASTTVTCTYPAGSASGDLLVMMAGFQRSPTSGTQTLATPSGWTLLNTQDNSSGYGQISATYWRFRGAETSVSVVCNNSLSQYGSIQIHAWNGDVDPSNPINVSTIAQQSTPITSAANRLAPSVTTTVVNCGISIFAAIASGFSARTFTWPGATERIDGYAGSNADIYFTSATTSQATAAATGTFTITPSGTVDELHTATIAIQPIQNLTITPTGETGSASDTAVANAVTFPTDAASSAELAGIKVTTNIDTGSGSEAASVVATAPATDSGSGGESATTTAVINAGDSGSFADTAFVKNTVIVTDLASSLETAQITTVGTETGSGVDLAVGIGFETGSSLDVASVIVSGAIDLGSFSESAFVSNSAIPTPDTGSGAEQPATVTVKVTEGVSSSESVATVANVPVTDSGSSLETAKVIIQGAVDSGSALESTKIGPKVTDSASAADVASLIVTVFGIDSGAALDIATVMVSGSDLGNGTDSAFRFVSGQILASRVTRIAKDLRIMIVEREPRYLQVGPQDRRTIIGFEDRRVIKVASETRSVSIGAEA